MIQELVLILDGRDGVGLVLDRSVSGGFQSRWTLPDRVQNDHADCPDKARVTGFSALDLKDFRGAKNRPKRLRFEVCWGVERVT